MAALDALQDNQKKQAAAKQGQVDAANSSLIGDISGMPAPAASGAGQPAPGAGLGSLVGVADKLGAKPAAPGAPEAPPVGPGGGKLLSEDEVYGPMSGKLDSWEDVYGGGETPNALRGGR